jgi:hypothetical protein
MAAAKPPRATVVVPLVARTLGRLDYPDTRICAFKCGHGACRTTTNDQHIGFMAYDWNFEGH